MNTIILDELNSSINDLINKRQEAKVVNRQIENYKAIISELKTKMNTYMIQLKKEEKDVEKLQSISFANLVHSLLNDKKEQLSKEEHEVLMAKSQIDGLEYELNKTLSDLEALETKVVSLSVINKEYKNLIEQKKAFIKRELPNQWEAIDTKSSHIEKMMLEKKEIKEAISAGNSALTSINGSKKALDSAAGWGTYDILGGGMIATMVKREYMATAQESIQKLQYDLRIFNKELADISTYVDLGLNLGNLLGVADYFFDGFLVDFAVQNKINNARDKVSILIDKMESIVDRLNSEYKNIEQGITNMNVEINELILDI